MIASVIERLPMTYGSFQEVPAFTDLEHKGEELLAKLTDLGIWQGLERINRLEPALRCADVASSAAQRLNEIAALAGVDPLVSPRVTSLVGLLFKAGQAVDEQMIDTFGLNELDPHRLGLYEYPSYAPERTTSTSRVLKLALLLQKLGYPWHARAILHGPHPQFFDGAELPTVLAALANANLAENNQGKWHSYLHPAVALLAIDPYARRSDELAPQDAKDWVDRAHVVAINTTLQHTLRTQAQIIFTDEPYEPDENEQRQRWFVVKEMFGQLGFPFPTEDEYAQQEGKLTLLKEWMAEYQIENRLRAKQATSPHRIDDHSCMVSKLLRQLGREFNAISQKFEGRPLLNEDYMEAIGKAHDGTKAFGLEELSWLLSLKRYEAEFQHAYPPEVVARGTVSLKTNSDAQLYAWLRHFEDRHGIDPQSASLANDFLSGVYHLSSLISVLLSYADLAVVREQEGRGPVIYKPDITERFLYTTKRYVSDPHTAIIGYAKLTTAVASLSWYLGFRLPQEGSNDITEGSLASIGSLSIEDQQTAILSLQRMARVFGLFGIVIPLQLRSYLEVQNN